MGRQKLRAVNYNGEHDFVAVAKQRGWQVECSTHTEDRYHHIDFWVTLPTGACLAVEVKGPKAIRYGHAVQRNFIHVEMTAVDGRPGWLCGHADIIAFEDPQRKFIFVVRKDLEQYVRSLGPMPFTNDPTLGHGRWITRYGRRDAVTLIPRADIMNHCRTFR